MTGRQLGVRHRLGHAMRPLSPNPRNLVCAGARDQLRKYPLKHLGVVIGVGPFHSHAHFCFIVVCAYWWCLIHRCCKELGIKKVSPTMMNLENSNFIHAFTVLRVISVAIYAYIIQDVDYPPVEVFLENPEAFEGRVNNAGAIVLLKFLRQAGIPAMQYQRAARQGRGEKLITLFAHTLHMV